MVTTAVLALAVLRSADSPAVGSAASIFSATDMNGDTVSLPDYKGKYVVIEWTNNGCPFVKKHYDSHSMAETQEWVTGKGVVWLSVVSSAPGTQGYVTVDQAKEMYKGDYWKGSKLLLDPEGKLGHLYEAKTTPHMFIIDPAQKVVYMGGIDNKRTPNPADIPEATNYVKQALTELLAGKPVSVPVSKPYGCSIKYGS